MHKLKIGNVIKPTNYTTLTGFKTLSELKGFTELKSGEEPAVRVMVY